MALEVTKFLLICGVCVLFVQRMHAQDMGCPKLSAPENGYVAIDPVDRFIGSTATYTCNDGYVLRGTSIRTCRESRTWSEGDEVYCECPRNNDEVNRLGRECARPCLSDGYCLRAAYSCICDGICGKSCIPLGLENYCDTSLLSTNHATYTVYPETAEFGSIAQYTCADGFSPSGGDSERTCSGGGSWNGSALVCRPNSGSLAPATVESDTMSTSSEGMDTLFPTVALTETVASVTGEPETRRTGSEIFGTLIVTTEESGTQRTSSGQPVTMLSGTMSLQTQGTTVLKTTTERRGTPSVTSRQPETSSFSTDGLDTTPTSTTELPVIESSPAMSSESPQPPSSSTLVISASTPGMRTPEELINVGGMCAEFLPYSHSLSRPAFMASRTLSSEDATALIISNNVCALDLIVGMCSLFYPPSSSTGLSLCQETCQAMFLDIGGCPIVSALLDFEREDCAMFPEKTDQGKGLCLQALPSTDATNTSVSTDEIQTPGKQTSPVPRKNSGRPGTPSFTSRQPEASSFSTDDPEATPASTTELPVIQSSPAMSSESPQPPSSSTLVIPTSTPGMVPPEELINVAGMCSQYLPYDQSLSRPVFMASTILSAENATFLLIFNDVCAVDLIVGMCSLFYPSSSSTGLSLCQQTCQAMFLDIGGCPIISTFLDVKREDCAMFPEETDQGNGLCLQALPLTDATTRSVSTDEPQTPGEQTSPRE